ncbi:hypothetical protein [Rhizobium sp. BK602]|uniref:hypothetical protein n=1 Tax=Rhizobium sp. BK602 TaxID=2586986 RepID=UPI00160F5655|nr:hypothetical protein [Rhizobium sp. BK602]MBB3610886.1 hypothetical protein [Rhizobium sp. BK602]
MPEERNPTVAPVSTAKMHIVTIKLTPEQRTEFQRLTGETIQELRIGVEDLLDIGDLVAN